MVARRSQLNISEKDIQKSILDYLRIRGYLCKRNNSGLLFSEYKGRKRAIRVGEAGWPDIEGLTKEGRYFGIEVKSSVGKLEESQKAIGEQIRSMHGLWFVARSLDDVIAKGL